MRSKKIKWTAILILVSVFALSGCWTVTPSTVDPNTVHPNWVLHHDFSLSPGVYPGALTDCYWVGSSVPNRNAICRIVEGDEEVGDHRNWDVQFFNGQEQPAGVTCYDLFSYGCTVVDPQGTVWEGCHPYPIDNGINYWCDYKTHNQFVLTLNNHPEWQRVLEMFWGGWSQAVASEASCAFGLLAISTGQMDIDADWLVSCADGPF
jgi:hypothetical protein